MTLHRVTIAAFAALLVLSGIGSLMARQGPLPWVEPVQLTDDAAETPPAVGGEVDEPLAPALTDAGADADAAPPDTPVEEELVGDELPAVAESVTAEAGEDTDDYGEEDEGDSGGD